MGPSKIGTATTHRPRLIFDGPLALAFGAIYGFGVGIGFAVAENIFYLSNDAQGAGPMLAISRVLSTSLMHATASSLVGISLGGLRRKPTRTCCDSGCGAASALALAACRDRLAVGPAIVPARPGTGERTDELHRDGPATATNLRTRCNAVRREFSRFRDLRS